MRNLARGVGGMLAALAAAGYNTPMGGVGGGSGGRKIPERNDGFDDLYLSRSIAKRQRKADRRKALIKPIDK